MAILQYVNSVDGYLHRFWFLVTTNNASAAAAAAKSLQSCPTLCDPMDSSPPGPPIPGILQARTLQWVANSYGASVSRVGNEEMLPPCGHFE